MQTINSNIKTPNINTMIESFNQKINSVIAFISGDLLATVGFSYFLADMHWIHPFLKLIMAFFLGVVGGLGGLVIKTIYSVIEPEFKKKLKIWLKK